ncbi:MAG TPA: TfoX/Sxy family protein [Gaiellales bacterium]|nr:TfoX/Sxy family protein [Gaiellales bacterium]
MAYDEELADRVREALRGAGEVEEKRMFGGLSFMVDGRLAVAAGNLGGLLVPVGTGQREALLAEPHVEPMVMGGRESRSWVRVLDAGVRTEEQLRAWVARGLAASRPPG